AAAEPVSLAGKWRFALDRQDAGIAEKWFAKSLEQQITLPGSLQNQGFGDTPSPDTKWTASLDEREWRADPRAQKYLKPDNFKMPWWLQPEKHYVGVAWYQRNIEIPADWAGKRVLLTLERPHWETRVWLDSQEYDTNNSLSTAHVHDLGVGVAPGKHTLSIRVDNRMIVDVGKWAHSVSDHTQGNWNGIVGRIELSAGPTVWIEDVQVFPNLMKSLVKMKVTLGNATGKPGKGVVSAGGGKMDVSWDVAGGVAEFDVAVPAKTWDEFSPALQRLTVSLTGDGVRDQREATFGLREIGTDGTQFTVNGRKMFFRGTLECCIFPLTGYPPTDVDSWRRIIRICQAHGLNHIRFHSWCPPEAAFAAADELGFYYQVEIAAWCEVGSGKSVDKWLYEEAHRVLKAYGNHPSFMLMPYGNEPSGRNSAEYLAKWVTYWRGQDNRRLYTSGSGWPQLAENQYDVYQPPRGPKGWGGKDYRADIARFRVPVIVHEMGQWCVFPNFDEMAKYTGPLKPKNFEIFRDWLTESGMIDQAHDFLMASGKLQALCYKEEIEAALRTPGMAGIQLLDLHDFPGQGTALVGILDPFWDSKPYFTPQQFKRFFNTTVPLARLPRRTWTSAEKLTADIELAHFGPAPLANAIAQWKLVDDAGVAVASGELPGRPAPLGNGTALGSISVDLSKLPLNKYRLVVGLKDTPFENDWNIFVYPAQVPADPVDVLVATGFDEQAESKLAAGGKVLLALNPLKLSREFPRGSFEPVFWNRAMFKTQPRHILGLLCDPKHPALAQFPTDYHAEWQWEDLLNQSRCIRLDSLPKELRPIVQPIDDWNTSWRLGLVFECRVGKGKLMVCSADISNRLSERPAARQLRSSLLAYLAGPQFEPKVQVSADMLKELLSTKAKSRLLDIGAKIIAADSQESGFEASNALDGETATIWHTAYTPAPLPMPHWIVIDLGKPMTVKRVMGLPRQDGNSNGKIAQCEVYLSDDNKTWGQSVAAATWKNADDWQTATLQTPAKGRYIKLLVKSEVRGQPFASLAEVDAVVE
ncbi:MAG: discoidin domain-containing protein, partial [Tepidisphaeraceae bacterium]